MAGKPSTQFYPGDWWRAVDLRKCCMATQGIWFNMLLVMWDEQEQGKIKGTRVEICRVVGCQLGELRAFIEDNKVHKFANVTLGNKYVTIINRRMYTAFLDREGTKQRVQQHRDREKHKCNTNVTPPSSTSTSTSLNNKYIEQFEKARKIYPGTKRGHTTELVNFMRHKDWKEATPLLLPAVEQQAEQWRRNGTWKIYIPHFQTWVNQRRWEQTESYIITKEEDAAAKQKALERKRQVVREDYEQYYRERSIEDLRAMLKEQEHHNRQWLINEILAEKGK